MYRALLFYPLFALFLPALTLADDVRVAVTIKPLHSLVAGVMHGVAEPALIMAGNVSPHHYSLRPSERRTLANADLIFWIGPELETFMPRILRSIDPSTNTVALIDSPDLIKLTARSRSHHTHTHARTDPHIWLSARNAHVMVDEITNRLIALDAGNADQYEANRQRLHKRISDTDAQIQLKLAGRTSAYLSYHDAYQYFEQAYGLNQMGFVNSGDEINPSARYVQQLRSIIGDQQIRCLVYEAPNQPALVDTLTKDFDVSVMELDAIGMRLGAGEDTWFEIMHNLAETYASCL
jgi:zinc transport system substrate-binding protein